MENIYRLKKSMVYPEKLTLDQVSTKAATLTTSSWCTEPLERNNSFINKDNINNSQSANESDSEKETSAEPSLTNSAMIANKQFIQDRVRHLVNAFSSRTRTVRQRLELPPTPSSISSHETTPHTSACRSRQITETSEPWWEDPMSPNNKEKFQGNIFSQARHIYNTSVIDPQGKLYIIWMSIAAFAVLYNVWVIPLRSTFPYQTPSNRAIWMFFDYFADVVYVIDVIFIQTRIMYISEGFPVSDYRFTRQNYLRKLNFKLDMLSLLPLDLLYLYFGPEKIILRCSRFFKLHTFWAFFDLVDKLIASPHIIRVTRTLLYMVYLIHGNACAYYAFSLWEGIGSNNFVYNGKGNAYIVCFYFATKTATSIGKNPKPTQEAEFMFMTFSWLMGVFVFALLIGQIRDIIATATRAQTECRKLVDETLEYMRRLNLPQDMQRRVQLWFNYTWETQHTLDENTIMDCLPHKTKTDIAINVHIRTLSKVNLFADCDEALLRELVLQLKSVIYLPDDIICKKGDVGKEMYIVQSGKVKVIGRTPDEVLATLSEGSVFGEISLLGIAGMNRRTADVRSKGYSNIFVLSKSDLNEALRHYPEAQELLNKKAKQLMKQNAELERRNNAKNAVIVISNPSEPEPPPKLLETVLQVVPPDSNVNRLLRYGSKGKKSAPNKNQRFKTRYSLPALKNEDGDAESSFQTKVTVHRSLS